MVQKRGKEGAREMMVARWPYFLLCTRASTHTPGHNITAQSNPARVRLDIAWHLTEAISERILEILNWLQHYEVSEKELFECVRQWLRLIVKHLCDFI